MQFFMNCPRVGTSHGVQSFSNWLVHCGSPRCYKPCQQTCSSMGPSLHGATDPGRILFQCGLPAGSQPPLSIHLLWCGVLHGMQVDICSTMDLHGLQGHSLPHHGLLHRRNSALVPGTPSPPPSSLIFVSAELFSHVFSLLSLAAVLLQVFPPVLRYVITEVLPLSLMGLALDSSGAVLELAGISSVGHGGSF